MDSLYNSKQTLFLTAGALFCLGFFILFSFPVVTAITWNVDFTTATANDTVYWDGHSFDYLDLTFYNRSDMDDIVTNNLSLYVQISGDMMTGDLNMSNNDIIDVGNITVSGYIKGQPIAGSIGSGIIKCSENLAHCGCMNITANNGLEVHYPEFTGRIVDTNGTEIECYFPEGDINVTYSSHETYFINSSCEFEHSSFLTFHNMDMSSGNNVRIFDVLTLHGVIEEIKGNTLLELTKKKAEQIKIFCSSSSHLSICNGFDITTDVFPAINVSSGYSVYLNTYLPSDAKSTLVDGMHLTHHENGNWTHTNVTGLNITHCDNGTDLVECTGNYYRQYPIYSLSWDSDAIIHQLTPLLSGNTYSTLAGCLEATPDYIIPGNEKYVALVHHIYCAKRMETAWDSDAWIDLRAEPVGAGGAPDLSIYLDIFGDKSLQSNWDQGPFNFTNLDSWFFGKVNSSDNWDNLDTPLDITEMNNFTANKINITCCLYTGTIQATDGDSISVQPTGDVDDFFSFKTPAHRPTIKREGGKFIYIESSNQYDVGISARADDTYSGTINYEKDTHKMTLLGKNSPVAIKTNSEYVNYFLFETYNHQPQLSVFNGTKLVINDSLEVIGDGNFTGNFSVDTSDFFVNSNTGNVGIGTTSSINLLTIAGSGMLQLQSNITAMICNETNAGAIYYNNATNKHYGCNITDWNALY